MPLSRSARVYLGLWLCLLTTACGVGLLLGLAFGLITGGVLGGLVLLLATETDDEPTVDRRGRGTQR